MRVLLDTNVLIAAFAAHGACAELLEHCVRRHELVTSEFILEEFRRNLVAKFGVSPKDASQAVRLLRSRMILVTPSDAGKGVCRDSDDALILATAAVGKCQCIVTGDKDLLALGRFEGSDIRSPGEFWRFEDGTRA